jgi:hypothetical protein
MARFWRWFGGWSHGSTVRRPAKLVRRMTRHSRALRQTTHSSVLTAKIGYTKRSGMNEFCQSSVSGNAVKP